MKNQRKYTDDDINFLKKYYPGGNWDKIYERFPGISKGAIYTIVSKYKIRSNYLEDVLWTEEDDNIIKDNILTSTYEEIQSKLSTYHTIEAIKTRATNLGCRISNKWSDEEIKILREKYPTTPLPEMVDLLPKRNKATIEVMAGKLGIISYKTNFVLWNKDEDNYIIDNWETTSDYDMALFLNRTFRAVKWRREQLGFFRCDGEKNYTDISLFLRRNTTTWKNDVIFKCDGRCIITGDTNYHVHHIYPVTRIVDDVLGDLHLDYKPFDEYTDNELKEILSLFKERQTVQLGACVRPDLHTLYHSLYGTKDSCNEETWRKYVLDIKNGRYDDLLMKVS